MTQYAPKPPDVWRHPYVESLYKSGKSTREVAYQLGISKTRAARIVKELGLSRSKEEAAKRIWKEGTVHWRTMRQRARKVWESHHGSIPKGFHIHHIDHDITNNSVENLELLSAREHAHHHHPPNPIPRWLRAERREYMRKYLKEYNKKRAKR